MTHQDAGKYSAKHPAGTICDPVLEEAVRQHAQDGRITCSAAHNIAGRLKVSPSEIGKTVDLIEYRITRCQLGLFGYSPEKKIITPADHISEELSRCLRELSADGKISCADCWSTANRLDIKKMDISAACEHLGIKISPCQLGAF